MHPIHSRYLLHFEVFHRTQMSRWKTDSWVQYLGKNFPGVNHLVEDVGVPNVSDRAYTLKIHEHPVVDTLCKNKTSLGRMIPRTLTHTLFPADIYRKRGTIFQIT